MTKKLDLQHLLSLDKAQRTEALAEVNALLESKTAIDRVKWAVENLEHLMSQHSDNDAYKHKWTKIIGLLRRNYRTPLLVKVDYVLELLKRPLVMTNGRHLLMNLLRRGACLNRGFSHISLRSAASISW